MKRLLLIVPLVALMLLGAGSAYANNIAGRVYCNAWGNFLKDVDVTVTGKTCIFSKTVKTDDGGYYLMEVPSLCDFEIKIGPGGLPCDVTSISPNNPTTFSTQTIQYHWLEWNVSSPDCSCRPPECQIEVKKSCSEPPATPSGYVCKTPFTEFSMVWDGATDPVYLKREDTQVSGPIAKGDTFTFTSFGGLG